MAEKEVDWAKIEKEAASFLAQKGMLEATPEEAERLAIEVPGLGEMIHLIPRAKITPEEYEAHKRAKKLGVPSPLSERQLETLKWKREVWLKIKRSATPEEYRRIGWYLNQIENVGDMMTAGYWGGKGILYLVAKMGLKVKGPAAKYVGWFLLAKDITDIVNMFRVAATLRGMKKGEAYRKSRLNPLSTTSKFSRGFKLKAKLPSIPDWIEIAQVTDQFFGVGISFGPIVGFISDLFFGLPMGRKVKAPWIGKKPVPMQ